MPNDPRGAGTPDPDSRTAHGAASRETTEEMPATAPELIEARRGVRHLGTLPMSETELLREGLLPHEMQPADQLLVLRAKEPHMVGTRFVLTDDEIVIGRQQGARIVLASDVAVSGRHARLVRRGAEWHCVDEGSRNFTFVNGKKLTAGQSMPLGNGATIQIGTTTFTFVAAPTAPEKEEALPYPLAVSRMLVAHQVGPFARVKALLDGIETVLRFVVATELAVLVRAPESAAPQADAGRDALAAELAQLGGLRQLATLSMGHWESLAYRLARLAQASDDGPIAEVARALVNRRGDRSTLASRLLEAVTFRNKQIGHGRILNEDAFKADEEPLAQTFDALQKAAQPLARHRLVSVADMEFRGGKVAYTLYAHQGALDFFPTFREVLATPLEKRWCYLLRAGKAPLSLSPIVAADISDVSRRLEIFVSEGIVLGPEGTKVALRGVTSNAVASVEVQWSDDAAALYGRLARR